MGAASQHRFPAPVLPSRRGPSAARRMFRSGNSRGYAAFCWSFSDPDLSRLGHWRLPRAAFIGGCADGWSCRIGEVDVRVKQPWSDISEEDLHAYLDGALDAARRFRVAAYLARFPQQAARLEAFRAQKEGMQALFDDVAHETPPKRLVRIMAKRSWLRSWAPMIVAGGIAGLLLLAGSTFARQLGVLHASAEPPVSAATSRSVIPPPPAPAKLSNIRT